MAHHIRASLFCLVLHSLGRPPGFLRRTSGSPGCLAGVFGGGVLFLDGPLLLPAGKRIAGKLGILPQRFVVQGIHICLFQLALGLSGLAVGLQLVGAIALPDQTRPGLHHFLGLVGALHAHVIVLGLPNLLMEFARHRIGRGIPQGMGELGGWFFLILQH